MLYKTTFPRCVLALGKVGALGLTFSQFAPHLSPIPAVPFSAHLRGACTRLLRGQKEWERGIKNERW